MLPAHLHPPSFYADPFWNSQRDFQTSPLPLSLIQLIKWICKSRTPECSAPSYSAQKMWPKLLISFISLSSPSSELLSSLHSCCGRRWSSQWPADIWGCWGAHVCHLLQFSYCPSHIQKIAESKSLSSVFSYNFQSSCHTQPGRERGKPGIRHIACRGNMGKHTHTPQSNKQPFKAQKTTEFIFLALKIRKQDGIEFLIAAQGSCAASVRCDAVFQAGGHCRRAQLHQMEFKALLSNVIHSLFPEGKKAKK